MKRRVSRVLVIVLIGVVATGTCVAFLHSRVSAQNDAEKADTQARTDFDKSLQDLRNAAAEKKQEALAAAKSAYAKLTEAYAELERNAAEKSADMRKRWGENKGSFDTLNQEAEHRLDDLNKAAAESWEEAKKKAADTLQQMSDWLNSKTEPQPPGPPSQQKT